MNDNETPDEYIARFRAGLIPDPNEVFDTIFSGINAAWELSAYTIATAKPVVIVSPEHGPEQPQEDGTCEVRVMQLATADKRLYEVWVHDLGYHPKLKLRDEPEEELDQAGQQAGEETARGHTT